MSSGRQVPRVGLLWRGDGEDVSEASARGAERLGPLLAALGERAVEVEYLIYTDDTADSVETQMLACDAVLVWVNPIQDERNRAHLDGLLRAVAASGVAVSARPDTIMKLGTKAVLHAARDLPFGSDVELYETVDGFANRFPARLSAYGQLVVKQGRGNGGNGVWKVGLMDPSLRGGALGVETLVAVRDARATDGASVEMTINSFVALAGDGFEWAGCLIDQPFLDRLPDGMLRCYFSADQVVGYARQWPKRGLLGREEATAAATGPASEMLNRDAPEYESLRRQVESEWLPSLLAVLDLRVDALPLIWDADFLFGPPDEQGQDTYVLCEINVSAVWPFPPSAAPFVADAALAVAASARRE